MRSQVLAAMTHHAAAGLSRRRSLLTATGAGLAAGLADALAANAVRSGGKKARKRCKNQVGACAKATQALCDARDPEPAQCDREKGCCGFLGKCNAAAYLRCLSD
jgi:hypothetical protein